MELAYSNTNIKGNKKPKARVITITSGKGGVGKSSTSTNLALALTALNKKVCVFDADASLANINILLGLQPKYTLQHLLNGEKTLKDIIIDGPRGLKIVPGATGVAEYTHLTAEQKDVLLLALDQLQQEFDYLIIDTAAGISNDVLDFVKAAQFSIVIITPEPTSLTDSFSLLKVLKRANYSRRSYILVNMAMNYDNSQLIYKRFEKAVKKYIDVAIAYLGYIQVDETMISSVSLQCPAVLLNPESKASVCFKQLAQELEEKMEGQAIDSFSDFWRQQEIADKALEPTPNSHPSPDFSLKKTQTYTPSVMTKPAIMDFEQASSFCLQQLAEGTLSNQQQAEFIGAINAFSPAVAKPGSLDTDSSSVRAFYNDLEKKGFPQEEIRDVVSTLEQIYAEKYNQGIHSFESNVLKLFARFSGSEDELRYVHSQLTDCYQRQFDQPLYNVIDEIKSLAQSKRLEQAFFDEVLSELLSGYQQNFSTHYKTKADEELLQTKQELARLKQQYQQQQERLQQATNAEKDLIAVFDKIQSLLPFNKKGI